LNLIEKYQFIKTAAIIKKYKVTPYWIIGVFRLLTQMQKGIFVIIWHFGIKMFSTLRYTHSAKMSSVSSLSGQAVWHQLGRIKMSCFGLIHGNYDLILSEIQL